MSIVSDDENRQYPKVVDVKLRDGFFSKFYAYCIFKILNLASEKPSIFETDNYHVWVNQPVLYNIVLCWYCVLYCMV